MKIIRADIGHSGQVHKTFVEALSDSGITLRPLPAIWVIRFRDPHFFCFLLKHGKAIVGLAFGTLNPFYEEHLAEIECMFVRRSFRKNSKCTKAMAVALRSFFSDNEVKRIIRRKASKKGLYELVEV